jgi:hypothetical protein
MVRLPGVGICRSIAEVTGLGQGHLDILLTLDNQSRFESAGRSRATALQAWPKVRIRNPQTIDRHRPDNIAARSGKID